MNTAFKYNIDNAAHTIIIANGQLTAICVENGHETTWYNAAGKKHRGGDLPAVEHRDGDQITFKAWYIDGKICREGDKPANITCKNDKVVNQTWFIAGCRGRTNGGPSSITYKNGREIHEYFHGVELVRAGGLPPYVVYQSGKIVEERWMQMTNKFDRIKYEECASGVLKTYYKNGEKTRCVGNDASVELAKIAGQITCLAAKLAQ